MKEENRQDAIDILVEEIWNFLLFECNVANQSAENIGKFEQYLLGIQKLALEKGE